MKNKKQNDGGPAFPIGSGDMRDGTGMSLRDYFAAKALAGMCSSDACHVASTFRAKQNDTFAEIELSAVAYRIADAMLAERAKS